MFPLENHLLPREAFAPGAVVRHCSWTACDEGVVLAVRKHSSGPMAYIKFDELGTVLIGFEHLTFVRWSS